MTRRPGWTIASVVCSLLVQGGTCWADLLTITPKFSDTATKEEKLLVAEAIKEWKACLVGSPKGQPINLTLNFTFTDRGESSSGGTSDIKADRNGNPMSADISINNDTDIMYYGTGPVPKDKIDALTAIKHEIGHALGFAGGSPADGIGYKKWNDQITVSGSDAIFDKGGLNVLLAGTDEAGRSHLDEGKYPNDLMTPEQDKGKRFMPSSLDFKMLAKAFGYQLCPEPSTLVIAVLGAVGMLCIGARRRVVATQATTTRSL
jgi:PEP-CTERM motif